MLDSHAIPRSRRYQFLSGIHPGNTEDQTVDMSNIGFYSRHLTDLDIDNISAAKRLSSLAINPVRTSTCRIQINLRSCLFSFCILIWKGLIVLNIFFRLIMSRWASSTMIALLRAFSMGFSTVETLKTSSEISLNISTLHSWLVFKRFHWINKTNKNLDQIDN